MRKSFKKIVAVAMAATMVLGSNMMAFAADSTGKGAFEGVEPDLPAYTAITLPTATAGTYNYIADPAGLIRKYADDTTKAKLPAADADKGIYFTDKNGKYTADSNALEITNENAADVDITVKVEVTNDDYDDLSFSSTGAWETTDKENELYIAAVSGTSKAAVTDDAAAELTFKIDGKPTNYEVKRTVGSDGKASYAYAKKTGDDLTWNTASFNLTGAINKNAEWKDGTVTVPEIKVTWTAAAHVDGPSLATTAYTKSADNTPIVVAVSGLGTETIASVVCTENNVNVVSEGFATVSGSNITFTSAYLGYISVGDTFHYKATTSGGTELTFAISGPTE